MTPYHVGHRIGAAAAAPAPRSMLTVAINAIAALITRGTDDRTDVDFIGPWTGVCRPVVVAAATIYAADDDDGLDLDRKLMSLFHHVCRHSMPGKRIIAYMSDRP